MAITPTTVGIAASLLPFFDYFRPTRSPYLIVVLVGISGLIAASFLFQFEIDTNRRTYWFFAAIPSVGVLILLTLFTFLHAPEQGGETTDDFDSQLRFSRSVCISSALICLILGSIKFAVQPNDTIFYLLVFSCVWQIIVFVLYAAARLKRSEPSTSLNHFQISLITASYLFAITTSLILLDPSKGYFTYMTSDESVLNLLGITSLLFWLLWISCQVYWTIRLKRIFSITVKG